MGVSAGNTYAQVDERLNGDGTGLPLGINEGAIGWAMLGVFTLVWTTWCVRHRVSQPQQREQRSAKQPFLRSVARSEWLSWVWFP